MVVDSSNCGLFFSFIFLFSFGNGIKSCFWKHISRWSLITNLSNSNSLPVYWLKTNSVVYSIANMPQSTPLCCCCTRGCTTCRCLFPLPKIAKSCISRLLDRRGEKPCEESNSITWSSSVSWTEFIQWSVPIWWFWHEGGGMPFILILYIQTPFVHHLKWS